MKAVILILKHATFLRLSKLSAESALTLTELDYQEANVDSTVQQHLTVPSQEHSVDIFVVFIMATDIGLSILSFAHIDVVSHCNVLPDVLLDLSGEHLVYGYSQTLLALGAQIL